MPLCQPRRCFTQAVPHCNFSVRERELHTQVQAAVFVTPPFPVTNPNRSAQIAPASEGGLTNREVLLRKDDIQIHGDPSFNKLKSTCLVTIAITALLGNLSSSYLTGGSVEHCNFSVWEGELQGILDTSLFRNKLLVYCNLASVKETC